MRRDDEAVRGPLKPEKFRLGAYWDAWVDDSRLVVLNALDAAERGAEIATRTEFVAGHRHDNIWQAELSGGRVVEARMIVNAAGPWVAEVLGQRLAASSRSAVRLVKGSHIVVPRLWEGDHAYILQQDDGRVVFALPYGAFSLVGTTDVPVHRPGEATISAAEIDYLCAAANACFRRGVGPQDVVWSYSGVRSLWDDGSARAQDVTRDYRLELDPAPGPKLLSVFGGKLTTARALAEEALIRRSGEQARLAGDVPDQHRAADHAAETGATVPPEPVIFMKATSAIVGVSRRSKPPAPSCSGGSHHSATSRAVPSISASSISSDRRGCASSWRREVVQECNME